MKQQIIGYYLRVQELMEDRRGVILHVIREVILGEINCNCWGTDDCKTGETDTTLCPAGYRDATDGGCTSATDDEPGP